MGSNFGQWQPLLVIISWVEELVRIRDRIILADLGDEVAESWEEALELPTDKEKLVDRKRLGGDSSPTRRQQTSGQNWDASKDIKRSNGTTQLTGQSTDGR